MKDTALVDFDGTIYAYETGWHGPGVLPDGPTPGAKDAIRFLREKWEVVVCSSRCMYPGGRDAIIAWLEKEGIEVDGVTHEKLPHFILIDDRAMEFKNNWSEIIDRVHSFTPWHNQNMNPEEDGWTVERAT